MAHAKKARAIGFNHVALEVGDIDEALAFYGRLFDFELRSRSKTSALQRGRAPHPGGGWRGKRCPVSFSISSTHGATA